MNIWQSNEWEQLQKTLGYKTFREENILVIQRPLPLGKCYFDVSRSSPSEYFWETLSQKKGAVFTRFASDTSHMKNIFFSTYPISHARFPAATRLIDLSLSEKEIFAQFTATGRRHIRQAEKKDLIFKISTDIERYTGLAKETAKRDGFSTHPAYYFENFLKSFKKKAELLVIQKEGEWLAAGIFVFQGYQATYYYGASSAAFREYNAATLLQWEAMKYAKSRGCTSFDLLGISADEENPKDDLFGVSRFKKKFGGKKVFFSPESFVVFSSGWFWLFRFLRWGKNLISRAL